jgi:signal transduction histidine kinase
LVLKLSYQSPENRELTAKLICAELSNYIDLKSTIAIIIKHIKDLTGVEAVAIRLAENDDYPYYVYDGFSKAFVDHENSICVVDDTGERTPESNGKGYKLDCLCGIIIRGKFDPNLPVFTNKGSFWSNNTSELNEVHNISSPLLIGNRNFCNACGYESVSLVPIKVRDGRIGLIQLNDSRKDYFTKDLIEFVEMIGEQVGIAVENSILYEKTKSQNDELQATVNQLQTLRSLLEDSRTQMILANLVTGVTYEVSNAALDAIEIINSQRPAESNNDASLDVKKKMEYILKLTDNYKHIAFDHFQDTRQLFRPKQLFESVVSTVNYSNKPSGIKVNIICPDTIEIINFPGVFHQIIITLLLNAYMHAFEGKDGGEITILFEQEEDNFVMKFSDNGVGMTEEVCSKVFEPFYTTKPKTTTGLGLYTLKNLIAGKLQGTIQCISTFGKGTEFKIVFPAF